MPHGSGFQRAAVGAGGDGRAPVHDLTTQCALCISNLSALLFFVFVSVTFLVSAVGVGRSHFSQASSRRGQAPGRPSLLFPWEFWIILDI